MTWFVVVDFRRDGEHLVAGPFGSIEEAHAAFDVAFHAGECLNGLVIPVPEDEVPV